MDFFAQSDKDDEVLDYFLPEWDKLTKELDRIDILINNAVKDPDHNSDKGQQWSREQTRRSGTNEDLYAQFNDIMQQGVSPAAGS